MNTKTIKFDLNKYKLYEKIKAKQGDTKSRFLLFQLLDGSIPFNLKNRSVRAYMIKPDGKEIFNDLIVNNYDLGYCTLELTNQALAVQGTVKIELMVTEEDKKLTSSVFELEVVKSINSEKSIVSTNEFTALLNGLAALSEYDNYKNSVKEMEINKANKAEVEKKFTSVEEKIKNNSEQLDTIVTQKNKLGIDISDKLFNTKPNDETFSNSDGIRKAIKYAVSNNVNSIFIPSGTWYIDVMKPIFVPNDFTVYGSGKSSVIKAIKSTYDNISLDDFNNKGLNSLICCGDTTNYIFDRTVTDKNITIKDLTIDGNVAESIDKMQTSSNYYDNGFGILLNYGGNFVIENVEVKNTLGTGILLDRNYNSIVNNCIIHDCGKFGANGSSRNGISFVGINDSARKGCILSNSLIYNNGDVGVQYAYTPMTISNNHIYGNTTFNVEGDSSYTSSEVGENNRGDTNIINNYISDSQIAITISNVTNQKINIVGNIIKRLTKTPIFVSQTSGASVIITNNNIANVNIPSSVTTENGIYVKADIINVSNNNISYFSNPSNSCISIDVCKNVILNSNIIYSCLTNKMINVRSRNATIINNVLECGADKSSRGINIRGNELKKLIIKNNTFENIYRECIGSELGTISANVFDISNNIFNNSTEGSCNCVNILCDSASTINTLFFNGNYCNKDTVTTMLRFLVVNSTITVTNYFGIGNYFNTALGSVGGNLHFVNEPSSKVEVNNVV